MGNRGLNDKEAVVAPWTAARVVNTRLIELCWSIGKAILDRQSAEGWGTRVIDRLSDDLRAAYPDMTGLSRSNIKPPVLAEFFDALRVLSPDAPATAITVGDAARALSEWHSA